MSKINISHQASPHRRPCGTQRGVFAEYRIHKPAHQAEARTGHLEYTEDKSALLVENEIPVIIHVQG